MELAESASWTPGMWSNRPFARFAPLAPCVRPPTTGVLTFRFEPRSLEILDPGSSTWQDEDRLAFGAEHLHLGNYVHAKPDSRLNFLFLHINRDKYFLKYARFGARFDPTIHGTSHRLLHTWRDAGIRCLKQFKRRKDWTYTIRIHPYTPSCS